MNEHIRKLWAEKTFELMNIGAGAFIFGQAFAKKEFSLPIAVIGVLFVIVGYISSYLLLKYKRR